MLFVEHFPFLLVLVQKIHQSVPVIAGKIVCALAIAEADISVIQIFACFEKIVFLIYKAFFAVKPVNLICGNAGQKLLRRCSPYIFFCRCNMNFSRCNERVHKMLFKRCFVIFIGIFFILFAKLERKIFNYMTDKFIPFNFSSVERIAAATCTV